MERVPRKLTALEVCASAASMLHSIFDCKPLIGFVLLPISGECRVQHNRWRIQDPARNFYILCCTRHSPMIAHKPFRQNNLSPKTPMLHSCCTRLLQLLHPGPLARKAHPEKRLRMAARRRHAHGNLPESQPLGVSKKLRGFGR
ncbi:MAG: hypothetical protein KatS3mg004_0381 [Bryobacteraceae bacterium]|nr:MAG: hypothetical protein KatS3mg004_0381 [Bryobacteraceae bacterium]